MLLQLYFFIFLWLPSALWSVHVTHCAVRMLCVMGSLASILLAECCLLTGTMQGFVLHWLSAWDTNMTAACSSSTFTPFKDSLIFVCLPLFCPPPKCCRSVILAFQNLFTPHFALTSTSIYFIRILFKCIVCFI